MWLNSLLFSMCGTSSLFTGSMDCIFLFSMFIASVSSLRTASAASIYASLAMLRISMLLSDSQTDNVSVWIKCFTLFRSSGWFFTRSRYFGSSSISMSVGCFCNNFVIVWRSGNPSGVSLSFASCVSPS